MSLWTSAFKPHLPDHCSPQNDFLLHFSSTFHTCVPTPLAFASQLLGTLSIVAWLFAQLPQIYKNWAIQSTSGLSIFFLVEWCLGDLSNLLGALFTHQASWQVAIGCYYVFVDLCLVGQWVWFEKLRHGKGVFRMFRRGGGNDTEGGDRTVVIEGMPVENYDNAGNGADRNAVEEDDTSKTNGVTRPKIIFRTPTFSGEKNEVASSSLSSSTIHRVGNGSSPMPSPSPRTMLLIACLIAIAQASPLSKHPAHSPIRTFQAESTPLEKAGTILSWISTVLYLGSRLPQLFKNYKRKSTSGLSPHLFIAAFMGNLFYSSALLTNPCAWSSFPAYGGGGWVGPEGSDRKKWILAALPFFLGAFGVLGLDASVGVQFLMYGEKAEKLVVIEREQQKSQWRKVSGWMRGWIPSISERGAEREALLDRREEGYGGL